VLACCAWSLQASTDPDRGSTLNAVALDLLTESGSYPARRHVLAAAEEQLVKRCMSERGHVYWPFVPPLATGSDEERIVDLPRRRTQGYGLAASDARPPRAGPDQYQPAYLRATFGDDRHRQELRLPDGTLTSHPTAGCVAESRAALYGDALRWARVSSIPQILDSDLRFQVRNAPRLAAARTRWAACMAAAGHPYSDPETARNALSTAYQQRGSSPGLRRREITIATADGECALLTDVVATELELRRTRAQSLRAGQRQELNELATVHCAAYRAAADVVGRNASDC
jgi:hypothetical protein